MLSLFYSFDVGFIIPGLKCSEAFHCLVILPDKIHDIFFKDMILGSMLVSLHYTVGEKTYL